MPKDLFEAVETLLFRRGLTPGDVERWIREPFAWSGYHGTTFGLLQSNGGPCGVLAVVQAHILKYLLFYDEDTELQAADVPPLSDAAASGGLSALSTWASSGVVVGDRELTKKQFLHGLQVALQQRDPTSVMLQLGLSPLDRPYYLSRDSRIQLTGDGTDGTIISYARSMHLASVRALENWPNGVPENDEVDAPAEKRGKLSNCDADDAAGASSSSEPASTSSEPASSDTWPKTVPPRLRVGPTSAPHRRDAALIHAIFSILVQACSNSTLSLAVPLTVLKEGQGGTADDFGILRFAVTETATIKASIRKLLPVSAIVF